LWTDPLDDLSHVYLPGGGLADVEVTGGEVRLKAGKDEGWIASEIIPARPGFRYDFVLLDATTPENSSVEVSILDATQSTSVIGFANETITPYERLEGVYRSIRDIEPTIYPEIRIQVNLVADGADRPTLQAWSLHYVPIDEWRDDFLGPWKMSDDQGLNYTDGKLEVNLTTMTGGRRIGYYRPFPALATLASGGIDAWYANSGRNDYQNAVTINAGTINSCAFGDFDNDGDLDLIKAAYSGDNSKILWTGTDGKLSLIHI